MSRLAMCLLCLLWPVFAAAGPEPGFLLGVGTHAGTGRDSADGIQRYLARGDFGAIRDDLMWSRIERRAGEFRAGREVRELDRLVDAAWRAGRQVVLILAYGNTVAGVRGLPDSAAERASFAHYVRWAVTRYRDRVRYFEVWNEWNFGLGSGPKPWQPGSAGDYLLLLESVYPLIKSLAPESVVLGAGIAGTDSRWLREFVELGGPDLLDGISVHPYVHLKGRKGVPERSIGWLDKARATVAADARWASKHFYVTEIGWPNSTAPQGVPIETVADYLIRFTLLARTRSEWIRGVWWYELIDGGSRAGNNEHNFGLYRRRGEAKPAAKALAQVVDLLARFPHWRELAVNGDARLVLARGDDGGGSCAALWSVFERDQPVELTAAGQPLRRIYGSGSFERVASGSIRTTAHPRPQIRCVENGEIGLRGASRQRGGSAPA